MPRNKDERPQQEGKEPFVPASPVKRTLAWTGLVYALMLLGMTPISFIPAPPWGTWARPWLCRG